MACGAAGQLPGAAMLRRKMGTGACGREQPPSGTNQVSL